MLRNLDCLVHEEDASIALTLSRAVMTHLGYSTDGLLAAARAKRNEYCLTDEPQPPASSEEHTPLVQLNMLRTEALDPSVDDLDAVDELVTTPELVQQTSAAVQEALALKLHEAAERGLPPPEVDQLRDLLFRYVDVFRLSRRYKFPRCRCD